jgi:hypothetical protein
MNYFGGHLVQFDGDYEHSRQDSSHYIQSFWFKGFIIVYVGQESKHFSIF